MVEKLLLMPVLTFMLERIKIIKYLGSLDYCYFRIIEKSR
jgi:hypothetical protein